MALNLTSRNVTVHGDLTGDNKTVTTTIAAANGAKPLVDRLTRQMELPPEQQDKAEVEHVLHELKTVAPDILDSILKMWRHPLQTLGVMVEALFAHKD